MNVTRGWRAAMGLISKKSEAGKKEGNIKITVYKYMRQFWLFMVVVVNNDCLHL